MSELPPSSPSKGSPDRAMTRAERIFVRISILQTIIAVLGVFTGAVALYAALNESDAVRKQLEASVWPMVQIGVSDWDVAQGKQVFKLEARNVGVGPARIVGFKVLLDGAPLSDWDSVIAAISGTTDTLVIKSYFTGRVISPGETVPLVSVGPEFAPRIVSRLNAASGRRDLGWELCYCSVFDACWMSSSERQRTRATPRPVDQCPDYGADGFRG